MISKSSNTVSPCLNDLQAQYREFGEVETLVTEQFPEALQRGDIKQARELQAQLQAALDDFRSEISKATVELQDGRQLLSHEFEGLKIFAVKNGMDLENVLKKVAIESGSVRKADFKKMDLTTLEGLSTLTSVEELDVSDNRKLQSLAGTPATNLKVLYAHHCGLIGDLTAIQVAVKLETLLINVNSGITSLDGIPTRALKTLSANSCQLTGDLTALADADNLERLFISDTPGLNSLAGIPVTALKVLWAHKSGLAGKLPELTEAIYLEDLYLKHNPNLDHDAIQQLVKTLRKAHSLREVSL